jgi:hypothetical protein
METKETKNPANISDLMSQYFLKKDTKPQKNLQEWQIWFFEFCDKYKIQDKGDIRALMSLVSRYRNALSWWRWLESYLSDYPSLSENPIGLIIFLWKKAKNEGKFQKTQLYTGNENEKIYKRLRKDIKKFKAEKLNDPIASNKVLLAAYKKYHENLAERYVVSKREDADKLKQMHNNVLLIVDKFWERLLKGSYKLS